MRVILIVLTVLCLSACESLIYKLPTRQGNVLEQKQLDQLQTGMTRDQVKFLLGTPVAAGPFRDDRWDYIGYYKSPRGEVSSRTVSLFFSDEKLSRIEGAQSKDAVSKGAGEVDVKTEIAKQKKEATEDSRNESELSHQSGIVLTPAAPPAPASEPAPAPSKQP
jgi:outer membrane protein assembly factor BamE